ncbi:sugar ABC transporter ATP-binding protein [Spiractinospora alimapuensis]|uniref:sugar ABC transporter ATP-binding protein n=1 Tax=Spiractinospora alimapuensis TaxID=2820884 RepID=UPI001F366FB9|nr:sugar ABC transporter ATP-binding protein [Spiractinospora alimapuensis]QVQ53850.1 sugar ABC transporter ATP-binding protein [Spiractinospora alimapuensis]
MTSNVPPAVTVRGVTKTYGKVTALRDVDLTLRKGTVHGLVGENGSGKSTLTKIIAGVVEPDSGTIAVDGEPIDRVGPRESIARGVRVIFQDLALFPNMTVAENLTFSGDVPLLRGLSRRAMKAKAREALRALELDIDLNARLGDLSTAERQLVEIARTVSSDGRIILMDEPTAALTHDEIEQLLSAIRSLSQQGLSFVFISHKLREIVDVADDVTVIRDGDIVSSGPSQEYDQERITELMTGGVVENDRRTNVASRTATPVMELRDLSLSSSFHNVDLALHKGRVLGLAGVVGSGRTEIGLAMAGLVDHEKGDVLFHGKPATDLRTNPRLQYVPDDRLTEGLFLDWSIADNTVINHLDAAVDSRRMLSNAKIREIATYWRDDLKIKAPTVEQPVSSLSGGNQQRVLLARALAPGPEVVILNNPTVGVDIGSRAYIHNLIRQVADDGTALLVISDEPAELLSVCDDILFVHEGRVVAAHPADELTEDQYLEIVSKGGEQ